MLISWNWLNRHVDLDGLDPREVGEQFTLKVAELDAITEIGAGLDAVRTVTIQSVGPVEGADRLSHVMIHDGERTHQLVCGAPNARGAEGRTAVWAPPGATLPNGAEIGVATIRGIESAGMLASEAELGLSEDHEGIVLYGSEVPSGRPLTEVVPVHDWVFEVDNKAITHRPDLWGHRGIAREVAILTGRPMKPLDLDVTFGDRDVVSAEVRDPDLCPRYLCAYFEGVTVGPSPLWLRRLLKATGVRPISNVVDLTNFVMMDVGNPLHAFDARFVADNHIVVRRAEAGESIRTLDGQDRECTEDTLLICDAEKPIALAGVMGGEDSEIRDDTAEVILEAASFLDRNVRRTSTRLHLRSESSARFEKALDPAQAGDAARLFTKLMLELIPGCRVVSPLVDVAAPAPSPVWIRLDPADVSARLGVPIPVGQIRTVLGKLGFEVQDQSSGGLRVKVPSWRATKDVSIPEDLIEEVGRLHGYLNIPPKAPVVEVRAPRLPVRKLQERTVRRYLSFGCGMYEVMSYAFTWRPILERLGADLGGRIEMSNPISAELDLMRRYLAPNLLAFAEKNGRYRDELALYEVGRVFVPGEGELPRQPRTVGFVSVQPDLDDEERYRRARGVIEGLLRTVQAPSPAFRRPSRDEIGLRAAWMHPARSALIEIGGRAAGYLTLLHPRARDVLDIKSPLVLAEVDLDAALDAGRQDHRYTPLPRFPEISYDVSFEVPEAVTAGAIEAAIGEGLDTPWLRSVALFANYHLGDGNKSVSFHLRFRADDRSLTDAEVNDAVKGMVDHVSEALGATLRGG